MSQHPIPQDHIQSRIRFPSTNWDWVSRLDGQCDEGARQALALLCEGYWFPVFAHLRRQGRTPHEAEDLTQGFFEKIIRTGGFSHARQERGRLRNYLLTSLQNFVRGDYTARMADKRGNGAVHLPIHLAWAEDRLGREIELEPATDETPERLFNRRWWAIIIDQAMQRVRASYSERGEEVVFARLSDLLEASRPEPGVYSSLAVELSMNEPALRVALSRLRKRVAQAVREVVAHTTGSALEVDAELEALRQ